jgi:hypothetical protein
MFNQTNFAHLPNVLLSRIVTPVVGLRSARASMGLEQAVPLVKLTDRKIARAAKTGTI